MYAIDCLAHIIKTVCRCVCLLNHAPIVVEHCKTTGTVAATGATYHHRYARLNSRPIGLMPLLGLRHMKHRLWLHEELMQICHGLAIDEFANMHDVSAAEADRLIRSRNVETFFRKSTTSQEPVIEQTVRWLIDRYLLCAATVFDCRHLPTAFVVDTGESVIDEPKEVRGPIRLPFDFCYFEFANRYGVLTSVPEVCEEDDGTPWVAFAKPVRFAIFQGDNNELPFSCGGFFPNEMEKSLWESNNEKNDAKFSDMSALGAKLVLGVIALLKMKLVIETSVPDPCPYISKARHKKGKHPISSATRMLTVNVPAVHSAAQKTARGTHESPCLHWRRGHDRTLHRGSEFERSTWVSKCLVGDPSKGFVRNDYQLVHKIPLVWTQQHGERPGGDRASA